MKPVQLSTSRSSSVILTWGSDAAICSIRFCAACGTVASSGVIFKPESVRISIWKVVRSRKLVHSVQFFLQRGQPDSQVLLAIRIDSERELPASLRAANFCAGTMYSLKFLNWREPSTQMSPDRRAFLSSARAHSS